MRRADTPSHIHFLLCDIIPQLKTCLIECVIIIHSRDICHSGVQIYCTHRMSECLILLTHRQVRLMVKMAELILMSLLHNLRVLLIKIIRPCSSPVYKKFCKPSVFFFTCHIVQSHKRHLGNLMTRVALLLSLFLTEAVIHIVCKSARCVQKLILSCSLIVCDRTLSKVSEAIKLMVIAEIREHLRHVIYYIICIKIAVILLCRTYYVDCPIRYALKLLIRMLRKRICDRLNPLGKVAVLKQEAIKSVL